MIIRLTCVMMDGTAPAEGDPLIPYVQHLDGDSVDLPSIPAGVDVDFEFSFVGQDGEPFDMTDYVGTITVRHARTSADPVFSNSITFVADAGTSFATHNDTKDEIPRTCVYDVQVESTDAKVSQPIPQSHYLITAAISDLDDEIAVLQAGVKLIQSTEVVTGAEAIPAGALVKASTTAEQYALWLVTDSPLRIIGAAVTECTGAGEDFTAQFITGAVTDLLSDGTDTIDTGDPVVASSTVDGRVMSGAVSDLGFLGFNVGAAVAATLDAAVSVR